MTEFKVGDTPTIILKAEVTEAYSDDSGYEFRVGQGQYIALDNHEFRVKKKKVKEPTGDGAVVICDDGCYWYRFADDWYAMCDDEACDWSEVIKPRTVLYEGVKPSKPAA